MSVNISVGIVNKRLNSTYVPSGELSTTYDVVLKESCSDHNPVFILKQNNNQFPYNYLQWGAWYYFITDVVRIHDRMLEVHCKLDALATYKAYILASSQFVYFDTTPNTELVDTRLSLKTTKSVAISTATSSFFETGCVLVGIVGTNNTGVFAMTPAQAASLLNRIASHWLDDADMLPVPDVTDFNNWDDAIGVFVHNVTVGFRQLLATGKAPDSIKSAMYIPVPATAFSGSNAQVWLGDYDTGITAKLLDTAGHANEVASLSIPWQFTDWRRNSPYTQIYIKLPYVGVISIPPSRVMGATSITVEVHVSQSGSVSYNLQTESTYLGRYGGNCASNFMIGASNVNPLNQAMSAGGGIAGVGAAAASLGFTPAGIIAAGSAALIGFFNGIQEMPNAVGGSGGGAYSDSAVIQCYVISHNTNVEPDSVSSIIGTPTKAVKSLAGLTGYVECMNASVAAPAEEGTIREINSFLNGGVYLE